MCNKGSQWAICGEALIGFRHQDELGRRALVVVKLLCCYYATTILLCFYYAATLPPVEILGFRSSNNPHLMVSFSLLLGNSFENFGVNIDVWKLKYLLVTFLKNLVDVVSPLCWQKYLYSLVPNSFLVNFGTKITLTCWATTMYLGCNNLHLLASPHSLSM